jgi:membrane protease YdiL (CAAX protease family)
MNKKKIIIYLVITYALAWTIQSIVSVMSLKISDPLKAQSVFKGGMSVVMFMPLLAALIANRGLKGMGWVPKLKGNIRWIFYAAFIYIPLTVLGMVLFFAFFPDLIDLNGSYTIKVYEEMGYDLNDILSQSGMSYQTYLLVSSIGFIYGPFINMFVALGEEVGWRGFLYPELEKGFGKVKTWLIGGAIWAAFHFPCMFIAGYEYGTNYLGAMWLGPIVFTVCCIALGMLEEMIYDKTKSIWFPALLHGSINAVATFPQLVMNANNMDRLEKYMIFGPLPNGIIAMIPTVIFAIILGVLTLKKKDDKTPLR